jgi:hypothetical protein
VLLLDVERVSLYNYRLPVDVLDSQKDASYTQRHQGVFLRFVIIDKVTYFVVETKLIVE